MTEPDSVYVDTPAALSELCRALQGRDWLALDTEFIREKTYYPKLCLIQLGADDLVACVDPLALDDLAPLWARLYDPAVTKVLHAAQQDLEIFTQLRGRPPGPVFDTQIAATLLGQGEQVGYATLVQQVLGVELDKSQVRTDWSRRPLSAEQLAYAAADVSHLRALYRHQLEALERLGRTEWLAEDFAALLEPTRYQVDPDQAWSRIKGAIRLKPRQLAVLQLLAAWREREAIRRDRPRRWIVDDNLLLDLARLQPTESKALERLRGLDAERERRYGAVLLETIAAARELPSAQWPQAPQRTVLAPEQEALIDVLTAIVRHCAEHHGVSPGSLCGRRDLERLLQGEDIPLLHGWRRALAGDTVQAFRSGRLRLRVGDDRLVLDGEPDRDMTG
ncbi:MAG: ribonuclease D [Candidatus Competibacterales bacterium]|nr:ribonuclease D [Candidatus Competibacterales bacterium]